MYEYLCGWKTIVWLYYTQTITFYLFVWMFFFIFCLPISMDTVNSNVGRL